MQTRSKGRILTGGHMQTRSKGGILEGGPMQTRSKELKFHESDVTETLDGFTVRVTTYVPPKHINGISDCLVHITVSTNIRTENDVKEKVNSLSEDVRQSIEEKVLCTQRASSTCHLPVYSAVYRSTSEERAVYASEPTTCKYAYVNHYRKVLLYKKHASILVIRTTPVHYDNDGLASQRVSVELTHLSHDHAESKRKFIELMEIKSCVTKPLYLVSAEDGHKLNQQKKVAFCMGAIPTMECAKNHCMSQDTLKIILGFLWPEEMDRAGVIRLRDECILQKDALFF